jgi:hypothetical protein
MQKRQKIDKNMQQRIERMVEDGLELKLNSYLERFVAHTE